MEIKTVNIKPGTILCWKEYNIFTKVWNKLLRRELPYNKFKVIPFRTEILTIDKYKTVAYEPIRKYNKQEQDKLNSIICNVGSCDWNDVAYIINMVRPFTFIDPSTISESKYYKKRDLDAESTEYIY